MKKCWFKCCWENIRVTLKSLIQNSINGIIENDQNLRAAVSLKSNKLQIVKEIAIFGFLQASTEAWIKLSFSENAKMALVRFI